MHVYIIKIIYIKKERERERKGILSNERSKM